MTAPIDGDRSNILDRALQLQLLKEMRAVYPNGATLPTGMEHGLRDATITNLLYLSEHALCKCDAEVTFAEHWIFRSATITAKGLDFLADDGGLAAILGVVTIKMHPETIRDLVAEKIDASNANAATKANLKAHLQKLPAAALQALSKDLIRRGLEHLPDATHWLQTLIGPL